MFVSFRHSLPLVALFASTLSASSALAQDNGDSSHPSPTVGKEVIIVTAPRYVLGEHGGPVRTVSVSGKVRFDDLDLSAPWGRTELKARVRVMASNLCGELERQYPVGVSGGPDCYKEAVKSGMQFADQVLADTQYDYWKR